ncbi:MAG: glycosyltransferase family 4 protein [Armatimonadota bacterium]|nr:glycosyltransferase family 4 protein [Armatimonadota bacterium]MDW8289626.1 glycosyltransferase family 4 protein [Armatimonadota bacterium]
MGCTGKRILIIVENLPVPFDRRVWMEATSLVQAGFGVSVISPRRPGDPSQAVIDGVSVYRYKMYPPTRGFFSFLWEFTYCWVMTFWLSLVVWRREGFDVIHACNPPDTYWLLGRFYKLFGKKYVFDHHDLNPELYESRFGKRGWIHRVLLWLERQQFRTADRVIATNESYRQVAIQRGGVPPERVVVVRSGPDLKRFHRVAPNESLRRGKRYLAVYLGVMGPQDGVDYLIRAVEHVVRTFGRQDIQFILVGDGDVRPDLEALAHQKGLDEWIHFTGRIPDEQLQEVLSTADIALAPDPKNPLNDVSTMNKVVEYMAMGLPIVSFDLKETRYSAGEAAVYATPNDECEFAQRIIELLDDPQRRQRMGEYGTQRVREHLAWEHSRKVLVQLYTELLCGKG